MRKLVFFMVVSLVMALAVPVGAKSVENWSDSGLWLKAYLGDGATHAMWNDSDGWFNAHYGLEFDCPETPGPEDLAWARIDGEGQLTPGTYWIDPLKGSDRYMDGGAVGVFEWGTLTYGFCDESDPEEIDLAEKDYELEFDERFSGDRLVKGTNTDTNNEPGDSNSHNRWRSTFRRGLAKIDLGVLSCDDPCTTWGDGEIGKWSSSGHRNSH